MCTWYDNQLLMKHLCSKVYSYVCIPHNQTHPGCPFYLKGHKESAPAHVSTLPILKGRPTESYRKIEHYHTYKLANKIMEVTCFHHDTWRRGTLLLILSMIISCNKDILAFQIISLTIFYLGKKFILSAKEQVRTEMKGMRQKFGSCTRASMSSYYAN